MAALCVKVDAAVSAMHILAPRFHYILADSAVCRMVYHTYTHKLVTTYHNRVGILHIEYWIHQVAKVQVSWQLVPCILRGKECHLKGHSEQLTHGRVAARCTQ